MTKDEAALPYNPKDRQSIVDYAQLLVGTTLRDHVDVDAIADPKRRKGSFGNAVEYYYFGYDINSESRPDFSEVGMELKTTPLKKNKSGRYSAKERLVIEMIDYMTIVDEQFETSSLMDKASDILLISYLYEKGKDPLDYLIEVVTEWGLPEEDMPIFKQDWETVVGKIKAGKAHELSGSDTLYLEACTKAADSSKRRKQPYSPESAKPRAWALKASYMTTVSQKLLKDMEPIKRTADEREMGLLELVKTRFAPYFGLTETELAERFGYLKKGRRKPKNLCALITKRILGVDEKSKIAEFEKAGIKQKTLRLKKSGMPKEAVSFPAFDYIELANTDFENSDFIEQLEAKYLFVLFREDTEEKGVYRLSDVMFWQMPDADLDEAKRCYDEMQKRTIEGHADQSVTSKENRCCHVRPHGRNAQDTLPTPDGKQIVKKCFWLNQRYLKEEIEKQAYAPADTIRS